MFGAKFFGQGIRKTSLKNFSSSKCEFKDLKIGFENKINIRDIFQAKQGFGVIRKIVRINW